MNSDRTKRLSHALSSLDVAQSQVATIATETRALRPFGLLGRLAELDAVRLSLHNARKSIEAELEAPAPTGLADADLEDEANARAEILANVPAVLRLLEEVIDSTAADVGGTTGLRLFVESVRDYLIARGQS